jgi:hypothetical protein
MANLTRMVIKFLILMLPTFMNSDNVPLKDSKFSITLHNSNNVQYIGNIDVGSNSQETKTVFSTATGLTWLVGDKCSECNITNNFDSSISYTFKNSSHFLSYEVRN